jgi:dynein heavy chain, axonemal
VALPLSPSQSVLRVAGMLKRGEPQLDEAQILMRALRDFNTPKIPAHDTPIFLRLINDLFMGLEVAPKVSRRFADAPRLEKPLEGYDPLTLTRVPPSLSQCTPQVNETIRQKIVRAARQKHFQTDELFVLKTCQFQVRCTRRHTASLHTSHR